MLQQGGILHLDIYREMLKIEVLHFFSITLARTGGLVQRGS